MKHLAPLVFVLLASLIAPVAADDREKGFNLMEEGAKIILRGLLEEMGPQLSQMEQLARLLGDFENYQMPEVLPNGDVLIRRKAPHPPGPPVASGPSEGDEIDL
jgi:hypothetical protein